MEITELTTSQKSVVIDTLEKLAIELRENNRGKRIVIGMCVPLRWLLSCGTVTEEGLLLVMGIINNEMFAENKKISWGDHLFCPRDIPPRIEWCEAQIKQLKTELYSL